MNASAIRPVYSAVLDLSIPNLDGNTGAANLMREAWTEWAIGLLNRRAAAHQQVTGNPQTIDFDPNKLGKQVPVAGVSLDRDWWESLIENDEVRFAQFGSRDFQGDGRFWRTDVIVATRGSRAVATVQMGIESTDFRIQPLGWQVRAPGLWASMATRLACAVNGEQVRYGHVDSHTTGNVGALVARINDQNRRLPVVVVAVENWSGAPAIEPALPQRISRELFGLAHVHLLSDSAAAWEFSDAIGSEHACYNGAVRIYWPGFDRARAPDLRTLLLPDRIGAWAPTPGQAAATVSAALLRKIASVTTFRFATPKLVEEVLDLRRQEQRRVDAARLRTELSASLDDAAMSMIEDALKRKDETHAKEIADLNQQLADTHSHYSKQLSAEQAEDDAAQSEGTGEIVVEYYSSNSGRRPVLDFADDEYPKDRDGRERYLESLTLFASRWLGEGGDRFEKVKSATVSTRDGRKEDLWEYRAIKAQGEWVRVFFALLDGRRAVLLHAFSKRQNRIDKGEIETAKDRLKEYLR